MTDKNYSGAVIRRAIAKELRIDKTVVYDCSDWTIFENNNEINLIRFASETQDGYKFYFDESKLKYCESAFLIFSKLFKNNKNKLNKKFTFYLSLKNKNKNKIRTIKIDNNILSKMKKINDAIDKDRSRTSGFKIKIENENNYYISLFPYPEKYESIKVTQKDIIDIHITGEICKKEYEEYKKENHYLTDWNRLFNRTYDKYCKYKDGFDTDKEKFRQEFEDQLPIDEFREVFFNNKRKCAYCGVDEDQLCLLETKRAGRGKRLEYDRIISSEEDGITSTEYKLCNIVLACYWCNNAKTDTFSPKDFKEIAKGINIIWNNKLENIGVIKRIGFPDDLDIWNHDDKPKENQCLKY